VRKWTRGLAAGTGHITTSAVVSSTGTSPDSRVPPLCSLTVKTRTLSRSSLRLHPKVCRCQPAPLRYTDLVLRPVLWSF